MKVLSTDVGLLRHRPYCLSSINPIPCSLRIVTDVLPKAWPEKEWWFRSFKNIPSSFDVLSIFLTPIGRRLLFPFWMQIHNEVTLWTGQRSFLACSLIPAILLQDVIADQDLVLSKKCHLFQKYRFWLLYSDRHESILEKISDSLHKNLQCSLNFNRRTIILKMIYMYNILPISVAIFCAVWSRDKSCRPLENLWP